MHNRNKDGLRFLYLPNENEPGDQVGPRMAFEKLHQQGVLSAYEVFSYLWEDRQSRDHAKTLSKLLEITEAFRPDVIFWQHLVASFSVDRSFLLKLKEFPFRPKLVYHEGDAYDRIIKRIPSPAQTILSVADLVFLVGLGDLASMVRKFCANPNAIVYTPHSYDAKRFGQPWTPTFERRYDVIMIANRGQTRIPGVYLPGGKKRQKLAFEMSKIFGERFAVFGSGWKGFAFLKGPVPFAQQEQIIRSSWVSINWGHYDEVPYYFSDRLPISLAAGVPHITNYQPGYEHVFRNCEGLYCVRSPAEGVEAARYLLSMPRERLNQIGVAGQWFAADKLEATKVYADVVRIINERLFDRAAKID